MSNHFDRHLRLGYLAAPEVDPTYPQPARNAMYHTPAGDRVLLGAERHFFTQSLAMIVDLLTDEDLVFGVAPFDELQRNQKLVVLYMAARGLL
jgi:hypothetical protein